MVLETTYHGFQPSYPETITQGTEFQVVVKAQGEFEAHKAHLLMLDLQGMGGETKASCLLGNCSATGQPNMATEEKTFTFNVKISTAGVFFLKIFPMSGPENQGMGWLVDNAGTPYQITVTE